VASPAEHQAAPLLPAYDGAEALGSAASWDEVKDLLIERGMTQRAAGHAVMTRGVRTGHAFHIITAGPEEQMLRDLRLIRSRSA